jgi:AraC-like DNA-binding protein
LASPSVTAQFRHIAAGLADVYSARGWDELDIVIQTKPVIAVFIDPAVDGTPRVGVASELIGKHPHLDFILYTSVSPANIHAVFELGKNGLNEVMTHGTGELPRVLRNKLEYLAGTALARRNVRALLPPLSKLPTSVAMALEKMFQNPQNYGGALDVARDADIRHTRFYRSFEVANLPSPANFLIAAKVWHGYSYLRESSHSVRDIAFKLGYGQPRLFVSHVMMVFGLLPSALRARLSVAEARECVSNWLNEKPRSPKRVPLRTRKPTKCRTLRK